jgi:hypothetical protein
MLKKHNCTRVKKMKHCGKCKHNNTSICDGCDDGDFWEETQNSFDLVISAVMFGCGMGGIIAAVFALST